MARIPPADIERLKEEISVERLVESSGVALKKSGKDWLGKCPFHDDGEPSLVVTPAKNLWHCFGCGVGGGPIDWVMKHNGVSFRHAVELLRDGSSLAATAPVKTSSVRKLSAPVSFDADDAALMRQVMDYYRETLKQSPEALAYLAARGLDHPELIDTFQLGYANRTLGLRLPNKQRKSGADIRTRLEKIGIYRDTGHERYNGSLVVPVFDAQGGIVELYGRKIRDDLRPGTAKHLYLPEDCRAAGRGVWNLSALQTSREIILCEALIDAMAFWCAGYRNVTAAYGTQGFTDDHLAAFKAHGTERVLIAYDRDEAGDTAAQKVAEVLMAAGIECWRIQFPHGMDACEYSLKVTPANKSLGVVIRKAVWLGKGAAPSRDAVVITENVRDPVTTEPASSLAADDVVQDAPPPASPVPPAPANEVAAAVTENEVMLQFGERRWRVRGLAKNLSYDVLKVNVMVSSGERFHVDTIDCYAAKARSGFVTQAAVEVQIKEDILKTDLGRVLLKLEQLQDDTIKRTLEPKRPVAVEMEDADRAAALQLLRDPELILRILADFEACGVVGEETNKLVGYLAAASRKLDRPLAVVLQSSSAAGKSSLMEAVLAFMPEEERVKYSAMTGQSLFYMGETNLKNKILAIVEEEGASRASYALKLLQSEGELTIASTGKDPTTGNLVTQEYRVEGPVMIFLTTTAIEIDEELMNRCLVLSVDEGREQTEAIHRLQRARRTLQGLIARQDKQHLIALHQNAQRLLRPLAVVNPFADQLTFLSDKTRTRRDHEKYLTLIDTIALLHQYQRAIKTATHQGRVIEYIEVTLADIESANRLAHDVLGRSLDELPPQTRRLLGEVVKLVHARAKAEAVQPATKGSAAALPLDAAGGPGGIQGQPKLALNNIRFTRKQVRDACGWSDTQLKVHLDRLTELEYLTAHRDGAGGRFVYELVYDGDGGAAPHLSGLIDTSTLREVTGVKAEVAGRKAEVTPRSRPDNGPFTGGSRPTEIAQNPSPATDSAESPAAKPKMHVSKQNGKSSSYTHVLPLAAAAAE